ncbi:lysostaphin resistance A-like protein [Homoserinimonas sp. A447]
MRSPAAEADVGTRAGHATTGWPPVGSVLPLAFAFLRVPLVAAAALVTIGLLAASGIAAEFPVSTLSALYLAPVNLVSLLLLRWALHREGRRVRDLIGFDRARLGRDTLWGLLWLMVLYLPFAGAIIGTMFLLYGGDAFTSFEPVFVPADGYLVMPQALAIVFAVVVVVTFAPLNAPTEELVYRGYAQGGLQATLKSTWLAVVIPAFGFGLQHVFFAATAPGMLVFAVAFFVWGLGAGVIYLKQGRLMPLIICHLIVNLFTSLPALIVPFVV